MSSSTRTTRSRFSSPAHQGGAVRSSLEAASRPAPAFDGSRSFMQRWLEPSVQSKASYEEAGLMRVGVLEGMAPLGVPPKPKRPENGNGGGSSHGVRRVILRTGGLNRDKSGAGSGAESLAAAALSSSSSVSGNVVVGRKRAASPEVRPTAASSRRSLPAKGLAKKNVEDDEEYNPGGSRRKKSARRSQAAAVALPKTQETQGAADGDQAAPALSPGLKHYPTAWALRTLYDEKSQDPEFDSMVTDVLQQTADDDTLDEFSKHIGGKKGRVNRTDGGDGEDSGDCYYFAPPSTATASRQLQAQKVVRKPTDAQYGELVGDSEDEEELEEPEELQSPAASGWGPGGEGKGEMATTMTGDGERRAAKKAKTWHSSSSAQPRVNGTTEENDGAATTATEGGSGDPTPPRKRRRRNSGSSESSLSSAMTLPSPEMRSKVAAASIGVTGEGVGGGGSGSGSGSNGRGGATPGTETGTTTGASKSTSNGTNQNSTTTTTTTTSTTKPPQTSQKRSKTNQAQTKLIITTTTSSSSSTNRHAQSSSRPIIAPPARTPADFTLRPPPQSNPIIITSSQPSSPPTSPTAHGYSSRTRKAGMPGRLAALSDPPSHPPQPKARATRSRAAAAPAQSDAAAMQHNADAVQREGADDEDRAANDAVWERLREARNVTNSYKVVESAVRGPQQPPTRATTPVGRTRKSSRRSLAASSSNLPPPTTRTTRSASKRPSDQLDETVSPIPFSLTAGDDSSTVGGGSRAVTPTGQRQSKRPKGLRVKSSPVKKSGGPAGGLPRLASEGQSSFRAGTPKDPATDNDEFCSACGNAGDVLCCDGCPRSFHFECVNLAQDEDLPDDWYCNECIVRRFPSRVPIHKGAFASALNNLEKSIPRAFSLPKRIQNRFEGVKAGPDGDYEEIAGKPAKKRTGYDEMPDLFKQRDDNQPVLCHACQKASDDTRAIIPCSLCPYYWHLDCLDPPLAVPPVLKTWRCPAHMDDVLADAPRLAPAHKFRKVKNAQPITPIFSRGNKNNGHIEIDWSDEPEPLKDAGWPDPLSFGRTYKVSSKGIILDFIEQLRKQGAGYGARQDEQKWVPYPSPAPQEGGDSGPLLGSAMGRRVDEMQASLNLIGLRQERPPSDGVGQLTSALLSAADDNMLNLMARGSADNMALALGGSGGRGTQQLTDGDRLGLRAMLAQMDAMSSRIREVLGGDPDVKPQQQHVSSMPTPDPTAATTPPPRHLDDDDVVPSSSPIAPKKEEDSVANMAALSEPTPPLTIENADGVMDLD
ncbi:Zinc finger domain-containing protein, PHD-finger [Cordyceps fumosorosea ARSEF 2679]|uniref:Zinc finger domain-containing protein, PHD-finger n=1 Tax=Cordyceps fumosorosea (strain ARSEF 2679) TaxID=1081104 RepID=A0A168ERL1_CORFA|nr:Zinc finger domain-containing protein, PHD-finger [Cordyceps fumosorosea ARSEF 2679]OAA74133.1 Zinc finger domain-containing protein, PHD-finger [Cordyceps fumosorosea ARSEF 2679]